MDGVQYRIPSIFLIHSKKYQTDYHNAIEKEFSTLEQEWLLISNRFFHDQEVIEAVTMIWMIVDGSGKIIQGRRKLV